MDFSTFDLDDETRDFWQECRAFLSQEASSELRESAWGRDDNHSWAFHRALAAKGWVAPNWPVESGGADLGPVRSRILAVELWTQGIPDLSRVTTIQLADAIRPWASAELQAEVFPAIAAGQVLLCQGITEPASGSDAANVITRAIRTGDEWVIDGQKVFTTNAQNCAYCFLLTRTDPTVKKHAGLTIFLVPLRSPGVRIDPMYTMADERTNIVFYDGVRVADRYRVGPVNAGWEVLNSQLDAEHALFDDEVVTSGFVFLTMLRRMFDEVRAWAGVEGPDGVPPAHQTEVRDGLAFVARHIAVVAATPEPLRRVVASEALRSCAERCLSILGAAGVVRHGEPGAVTAGMVERIYRAAPATSIYGGTTEVFRNYIAEHVLGLPRQRPAG